MRQFNRDQAIVNTMNQFKPQAVSGIDWANALENYNDAYNEAQDKQKQQDLADALMGETKNRFWPPEQRMTLSEQLIIWISSNGSNRRENGLWLMLSAIISGIWISWRQ